MEIFPNILLLLQPKMVSEINLNHTILPLLKIVININFSQDKQIQLFLRMTSINRCKITMVGVLFAYCIRIVSHLQFKNCLSPNKKKWWIPD